MTAPTMTMDTPDPLAWAYAYASRGWRVLPIKPGEKRPPMGAWQDAATIDLATIKMWWTQLYRGHGVGVATGEGSGIFVLDVDVAGDKLGDETLAALENKHGELPTTPTVVTPSGGRHYYFTLPEGADIRNDAGRRLGAGLDIRGEGGQVVAPPTSRGAEGYEWVEGTWELEPAEAPSWLLDRLVSDPITAKWSANYQLDGQVKEDGPAQRYNARTTWSQLLEADGWTLASVEDDGEQRWARPGKDAREGISATVGHGGGDQLTVFTSSIPWLPEGSYSRFGYYACRHHGGDRSAAARSLRTEDFALVDAWIDALPSVAPEEALMVDEDGEVMETGWDPVDLTAILSGDYEPPKPELLQRADGECMLYKARINALYGESGSGKSWVAMAACAQVINRGGHVIYIDLEDHPGSVLRRMQDLGCSAADLLERFHYISPMLAWHPQAAANLVERIQRQGVELAVIDSTGEAMALDGAEPNSDDDTARWFRRVPRTLARAGAAVLLLDHVPKAKDAPLGFAIGSQRKRAAIDGASYRVDSLTPPAKGAEGRLRLVTAKDRGGYHQQGRPVAEIIIRDGDLVGVELSIIKPENKPGTALSARIGEALSGMPEGCSATDLRKLLGIKKETLAAELEDLKGTGNLAHTGGGSQSRWHLVKQLDGYQPPVDNSDGNGQIDPSCTNGSLGSQQVRDASAQDTSSIGSPGPTPKGGTGGTDGDAGMDPNFRTSSAEVEGREAEVDGDPVDNSTDDDWLI